MKIILPYPHIGQIRVREQAKRWNFLAAGRRWRKTTLLLTIAIEAAINGLAVVWGSPTYKQVNGAWLELKKAVPDNWANYNQQRRDVLFPTGGRIHFRSLDAPNNARGLTADIVLVDEAGFCNEDAWYKVLLPMLLDTRGVAWVAGTPNRRNWFYAESIRARDRKDGMAWNIPTFGVEVIDEGRAIIRKPHPLENPEITFQDVKDLFDVMTVESFRQEVLAQFLENSGSVFAFLERSITLQPNWTNPKEHKGHTIVAGVDWGKLQDYTAISIGCADCKRELELRRFLGMEYRLQRQRLEALTNFWNIEIIEIEKNSIGEVQFEELIYAGLPVFPFTTTAKSKGPMIERLAFSIEKAEWQYIEHPAGTGELLAYEKKVNTATGHISYQGTLGTNDDTVIARGLMQDAALGAGPLL